MTLPPEDRDLIERVLGYDADENVKTLLLTRSDLSNLLAAARAEATERAERMERERDEARQGERNLSEHARKVAGEANEAFGVVEHMDEFWDACGYPSNRGHLTPAEQVSALVRERDDAETRAQSAQAEATRLKEKLDEAGKVIAEAVKFAERAGGTCLGVAMSGSNHPNPDGALMDLFHEATSLSSQLRSAALRWTEEATQGETEVMASCAALEAALTQPNGGQRDD